MPDLKFLLDADMPISSAKVIRSFGYDVEDVRDIGTRAATDQEIIHYALQNKRIIVQKIPISGRFSDTHLTLGQLYAGCLIRLLPKN